ncbi:MAG: PEP-CTERM sorting domain-containing protein [Fimbriimonadaceae bacterium]|nr:PEP-CTERM sorting domain-containing protein [Fimbriimonadaceae bacterium]
MKKLSLLIAALSVCALANAQASLTGLSGFGVNGWVASAASGNVLDQGNNARGMAYNPVTGNVYVARRDSGSFNGVWTFNGTTGAQGANSFQFGSGIVTGGTFAFNQIGVNSGGQIYMANLVGAAAGGGTLRLYRWDSEADGLSGTGPKVQTFAIGANIRVGDSMDVKGGIGTTSIILGRSGTGISGYVQFDDTGTATTFTGTGVTVPVAGTAAGSFRQGITFAADAGSGAPDVYGKQWSSPIVFATNGANGGSVNPGTLGGGTGAMDYKVINGIPYLAILDNNSSNVLIYNMSTPSAPTLVVSGTSITGPSIGNGNGAGSVQWGETRNDGTTVLYAMNTNNGLQALVFNPVPEPMTMGALALAALAAKRRRKNKKS